MFLAQIASLGLNSIHGAALWMFQESAEVGWNRVALWHQMGWLAKGVVIILFIMSAWSIGVMIDRWMAFLRPQAVPHVCSLRGRRAARRQD